MTKDSGASLSATGLSSSGSSQQAVSPRRASIPSAASIAGRRNAQTYLDDTRHFDPQFARFDTRQIMDEHFARARIEATEVALDCLLNLVADARRFDEDGDCDGVTITYFIETGSSQLTELAESLGLRIKWEESVLDAMHRVIDDDAQAIETRSAKTEGLGPKDESAVAKPCAQGDPA